MDFDGLLNLERRTGIKQDDIDDFVKKASEVQNVIRGMAEGTIDPEKAKVEGIETEEELLEKEKRYAKIREEAYNRELQLKIQRKQEEKERWWKGARLFYSKDEEEVEESRVIELGDEEEEKQIQNKLRYSLDYSKWDTWKPTDEASLEEEKKRESMLEDIKNKEFEKNNPEFCQQFIEDNKKRTEENKKKLETASVLRIKGNKKYQLKKYQEALELYTEGLKSNLFDTKILMNIALCHIKLLNSPPPVTNNKLSYSFPPVIENEHEDEAFEYLERVLFIEPHNSKAIYQKANLLIQKSRFDEAKELINIGISSLKKKLEEKNLQNAEEINKNLNELLLLKKNNDTKKREKELQDELNQLLHKDQKIEDVPKEDSSLISDQSIETSTTDATNTATSTEVESNEVKIEEDNEIQPKNNDINNNINNIQSSESSPVISQESKSVKLVGIKEADRLNQLFDQIFEYNESKISALNSSVSTKSLLETKILTNLLIKYQENFSLLSIHIKKIGLYTKFFDGIKVLVKYLKDSENIFDTNETLSPSAILDREELILSNKYDESSKEFFWLKVYDILITSLEFIYSISIESSTYYFDSYVTSLISHLQPINSSISSLWFTYNINLLKLYEKVFFSDNYNDKNFVTKFFNNFFTFFMKYFNNFFYYFQLKKKKLNFYQNYLNIFHYLLKILKKFLFQKKFQSFFVVNKKKYSVSLVIAVSGTLHLSMLLGESELKFIENDASPITSEDKKNNEDKEDEEDEDEDEEDDKDFSFLYSQINDLISLSVDNFVGLSQMAEYRQSFLTDLQPILEEFEDKTIEKEADTKVTPVTLLIQAAKKFSYLSSNAIASLLNASLDTDTQSNATTDSVPVSTQIRDLIFSEGGESLALSVFTFSEKARERLIGRLLKKEDEKLDAELEKMKEKKLKNISDEEEEEKIEREKQMQIEGELEYDESRDASILLLRKASLLSRIVHNPSLSKKIIENEQFCETILARVSTTKKHYFTWEYEEKIVYLRILTQLFPQLITKSSTNFNFYNKVLLSLFPLPRLENNIKYSALSISLDPLPSFALKLYKLKQEEEKLNKLKQKIGEKKSPIDYNDVLTSIEANLKTITSQLKSFNSYELQEYERISSSFYFHLFNQLNTQQAYQILGNAARCLIYMADYRPSNFSSTAPPALFDNENNCIEIILCSLINCPHPPTRKNLAIIVAKACKYPHLKEKVQNFKGIEILMKIQNQLGV